MSSYLCSVCSLRFLNKFNLAKHLTTSHHLYLCNLCTQTFETVEDHRLHIEEHNKCSNCNKIIPQKI